MFRLNFSLNKKKNEERVIQKMISPIYFCSPFLSISFFYIFCYLSHCIYVQYLHLFHAFLRTFLMISFLMDPGSFRNHPMLLHAGNALVKTYVQFISKLIFFDFFCFLFIVIDSFSNFDLFSYQKESLIVR